MRKWIGCISLVLLLTGIVYTHTPLERAVTRAVVRAEVARKPYYSNERTSQLCEQWRSCAKWAQESYEKDLSFRVYNANEVTTFRVYRHWARYETHLHVQAVYQGNKIQKTFEQKVSSRRGI
ncbi:MAG: hypothetical protein J6X06_06505 [Elusimicrobiaceae bacterium]|nr:hypothetical protein [Elusimicrobiaceae bacterium]